MELDAESDVQERRDKRARLDASREPPDPVDEMAAFFRTLALDNARTKADVIEAIDREVESDGATQRTKALASALKAAVANKDFEYKDVEFVPFIHELRYQL